MSRKAFSYLRFSNKEQRSGDSVRRQLALRETYCNKNKVVLDTSLRLEDLGVSAFKGKHRKQGALSGFLAAVETGRVPPGSLLLIENLDRLSREEVGEQLELFMSILRRGITIVTLSPEAEFTKASVNDIAQILTVIITMSRAHEESARKSDLIGKAWAEKRANASEEKLTAKCPSWLRLNEDRKSFTIIESAADSVRRIFELSAGGMGSVAIARYLNDAGVPPIGKRSEWCDSYIRLMLKTRNVIGEYEPRRRANRNVPNIEPIPNYYPAVISEELFYRVQQAIKRRWKSGGHNGKKLKNLLSGIVRDARDGSTMMVRASSQAAKDTTLISSAAHHGAKGSVRLGIRNDAAEHAVLCWASVLKIEDILPANPQHNETEDAIRAQQGKLADIEYRLSKIKSRAKDGGNLDAILDLMQEMDADRSTLKASIEQLKRDKSTPEEETIFRIKEVLDRLATATGEELLHLRLRLRTHLRDVIERIWCLTYNHPCGRFAHMQILLRSGAEYRTTAIAPKGPLVDGPAHLRPALEKVDLREPFPWPIEASEIEKMIPKWIATHKKGGSRTKRA